MRRLGGLLLACWALLADPSAAAQDRLRLDPDQPYLLLADEVTYDTNLSLVQAIGNVELSQGDRILLADRLTYNADTDLVTAQGNITLLEPDGTVLFAEYLELDKNLTEGFVTSIRMLMADNARMAANGARRYPDERTVLSKVVYSPCDLCPSRPDAAPLWQLKAVRVTHDKKKQTVRYQDAVLEVLGFPVAYTPFFEHADPSVDRKSGFLAPIFGSNSDLGLTLQLPYYWAIAYDRDFTIAPIFTSKEGVVLAGEYRALTAKGQYDLSGSLTYVNQRDINNEKLDEKELRGHIFGSGRFNIDPVWRWGFDVERATDDTYLRRYEISDKDTLTSDLFVEGFRGRNYAEAAAFAFQGLEIEDDPGRTPLVAPLLNYSYVADRAVLGGQVGLDANAVSLYRNDGLDSRRLSLIGRWDRPIPAPWGQLVTLTGLLRGDVFWTNDNPGSSVSGSSDEDIGGRVHPLAAIDWRWPFVRRDRQVSQIIEPIAQLIVAPHVGTNDEFPNEDSRSLEFDDTNLFRLNRFPGHDRLEGGPRLNYGVRYTAFSGSRYVSALVGQVLRTESDDTFAENTGLDKEVSDFVTSVTFAPSPYFDVTHRMRLDQSDLTLRRHEIYGSAGTQNLRLSGTYVKLDRELTADQLEPREEIYLALRGRLTRYISFLADARRDLTGDGHMIRNRFALTYEDECVLMSLGLERNFTRDRDIEPSTSLKFRIILQTLG